MDFNFFVFFYSHSLLNIRIKIQVPVMSNINARTVKFATFSMNDFFQRIISRSNLFIYHYTLKCVNTWLPGHPSLKLGYPS